MSGAEAITVIQLVDSCIGIAKAIADVGRAVHDAQGLTPRLRDVLDQLPIVGELLETAKDAFEKRKATEDGIRNAEPILRQCEKALEEVREIFRRACPKEGEALNKRIWKGTKTAFLGRESHLLRLLAKIHSSLRLLEQKEVFSIGHRLDALQNSKGSLNNVGMGQEIDGGRGHISREESSGGSDIVVRGPIDLHGVEVVASPAGQHSDQKKYLTPFSIVPYPRDPDYLPRARIDDDIRTRLCTSAGRTALVGFGGVGKSQLAVEFAHRLRQESPQTWVFWIHANGPARFELGVRDIVDQLELHGSRSCERNSLELLQGWLRDGKKGRWLIVLDNADDATFLLQAPSTSNEIQAKHRIDYIPICDHGSMLITTRNRQEALRLVYENQIIDVPVMSAHEAETLFEKKLNSNDVEYSQKLALALDCVPLAITHAAAYIHARAPRCNVRQYYELIEKSRVTRSTVLGQDMSLPSRDQQANSSVLRTWEVSFDHIRSVKKSAADLLGLMSFCDKSAIPEILINRHYGKPTASEINMDFDEDIAILRNFSFISPVTEPDSWTMHRLVQDAVQLWLERSGRRDESLNCFVHQLFCVFPAPAFENRALCSRLFPHARAIMYEAISGESVLYNWAYLMAKCSFHGGETGKFNDALQMASSASLVFTQQYGENHELGIGSQLLKAQIYNDYSYHFEAQQILTRLIAANILAEGSDKRRIDRARQMLATSYASQGRYVEAESWLQQVSKYRNSNSDGKTSDLLESGYTLACLYYCQGRLNDAGELWAQKVSSSRLSHGERHPHTLMCMANLATTYHAQGHYDSAEQLFLQVWHTREDIEGGEHPSTLKSMLQLARVFERQGRNMEAKPLLQRALRGMKTALPPAHYDTLSCMYRLSKVLASLEELEEAELLLREALDLANERPNDTKERSKVISANLRWVQARRINGNAATSEASQAESSEAAADGTEEEQVLGEDLSAETQITEQGSQDNSSDLENI